MPDIDALFPEAPRTLYTRNPLEQVICQVRFPTILKIEAHPPAEFQELIRDLLPVVARTTNAMAMQVPQELLKAMGVPASGSGYSFSSEDETVTANLTADSLTVSTDDYVRWEQFWGACERCFEGLVDTYKPNFYIRLGLRYRNVINRAQLGLKNSPWSTLLNVQVLGELAIPDWEAMATECRRIIRCKSADGGDAVHFQHGILSSEDDDEQNYLIDFDFYRDGRIEVDEAPGVFARFNRRSGRSFRWAIADDLHAALEPRPL
jgi:uncharacterized protein (TIGR04255 family)